MAPELVIADAPYKTYPGGVITVRCADWVAGASATAASETDALAHDGEGVRDTQQVDDIHVSPITAFGDAEATLECIAVPFVAGLRYYPFISYRIEGEIDLTDEPLLRLNNNEITNGGVVIGMEVDGDMSLVSLFAPPLPHYRYAVDFPFVQPTVANPDMIVKVAVESGSTYEAVIDQITFIPHIDPQFHNLGIGDTEIVDGADGGDDLGKFTWTPVRGDQGHAGGGDFQQKADASTAEWYERQVPDDFVNAEPGPRHVYGIHGAGYRGARVWAEDTFDNRTTPADPFPGPGGGQQFWGEMGVDPTGYGYATGSSAAAANNIVYVDGAGNCVMQIRHFQGGVVVIWGEPTGGTLTQRSNHGRAFRMYDQWEWEGRFTYVSDANLGPLNNAQIRLRPNSGGSAGTLGIFIELEDKYVDFGAAPGSGHVDISSWFGEGAEVGWKIQVERYVVRYKLWDASGAEPGTWDHEEYLQIQVSPFLADDEYDYDDNVAITTQVTDSFRGMRVDLLVTDGVPALAFPLQINLTYMKMSHDPKGEDPGGIGVAFYSPEGDSWGEIDVPWGAAYFVYWGSGVISEPDEFDPDFAYLNYSSKVWNDEGVPQIQRAETVQWITLGIPFNIVPMNWRSGERAGQARRILVGS